MKKFLINVLLFSLAFFLLEKLFYIFLLLSPSLENDNRLEKVINGEVKKDVIIFGSSRGARNIIAGQIEDSSGLSTYNLSYPGSDIEFHEFLLRSLLKYNEKPKIVLLAIDVDNPHEFLPSESIKFRLDRLYPLSKYNYINNELISRGEKNFLSKIFILSRINKRNFDIRKKHFSDLDTIIACGSMPIYFQRENRAFIYNTVVQPYQTQNELGEKVNAFLRFQDLCVKNDIKLVLVFSPNYMAYNYNFEKRLSNITNKNVDFFVYDTVNTIYKDKSYFYDESHLLTKGSVIFTNEIIKFLKSDKL